MDKLVKYFSQSKTLNNFLDKLKNRGLKHAYLFSSIDELKNKASCVLYSLLINCKSEKKPCFNCKNCLKILNNNALDIFVYPKNKAIIVDDIKDIIDSCYISSAEFNYKIYILNNFDEANLVSQNKFLKTLEEPPKNVIFLLNCKNLNKVLDTIKSRCEVISLPQIPSEEIEEIIRNNEIEFNKIIQENCDNELGTYLLLNEKKVDETFEFCIDLLNKLNNSSEILFYSSKILKDKDNLFNYFYAFNYIFKDLLIAKINPDLIKNVKLKDDIVKISENFHFNALLNILNYMLELNKMLGFNTNESLVIDNMLINILEEKYKWK